MELWFTLTFRLWQYGKLQVGDTAGLAGTRSGIRLRPRAAEVRWREFTLADVDAARERSGVVGDAVVGDLQVMAPGVDEDAAAALRAVADAQAVNARRVAPEVARERVVGRCGVGAATACRAGAVREQERVRPGTCPPRTGWTGS